MPETNDPQIDNRPELAEAQKKLDREIGVGAEIVKAIRAATRDPKLRFFRFAHLPAGPMRETSERFANLAESLCATVPSSAERTIALNYLLIAKDAAVRAAMPPEEI